VVKLALATHIPPSVWLAEDPRAMETAWVLLEEAHEQAEDAARDARRRAGH
jgi:hypothetical protein